MEYLLTPVFSVLLKDFTFCELAIRLFFGRIQLFVEVGFLSLHIKIRMIVGGAT